MKANKRFEGSPPNVGAPQAKRWGVDYPDYRTQGTSKKDLVENLKSLLEDIESDV